MNEENRKKSRSGGGARPIGRVAGRLVATAFGRRGFVHAEILTRWAAIVGADLADHSQPMRLRQSQGDRDGVLEVRVLGAGALEFQHREPEIIERINAYFGYRAVTRLALVQGPIQTTAAKRRPPPPALLGPAEERAIDAALAPILDPRLKTALLGLGRQIAGKRVAKRTRP